MDVIDVEDESQENKLGVLISGHPLVALGGAMALGYLLGGGLATRTSRQVLRRGFQLAMQLAMLPQYEDDLAEVASRLGQTLRKVSDGHGAGPQEDDPDDFDDSAQENAARDL